MERAKNFVWTVLHAYWCLPLDYCALLCRADLDN